MATTISLKKKDFEARAALQPPEVLNPEILFNLWMNMLL